MKYIDSSFDLVRNILLAVVDLFKSVVRQRKLLKLNKIIINF